MQQICDDFAAEADTLDAIVAVRGVDLSSPTPAPGWSIGDQIGHLWFFDQRALLAITDADAFAADAEVLAASIVATGGTELSVEPGRSLDGGDLLAAWRRDRAALIEHARQLDPSARVPWYGPSMGARSFITARLMETWAHGQDVVDALGVRREPTSRLRHVAHIGVGARPFSYVANGRDVPAEPVRVELTGPGGEAWAWGPQDVADRVAGNAVEFCLVVTQRRHLADTSLDVTGPSANEWMSIAQAFAGPPGEGRRPGQFDGR